MKKTLSRSVTDRVFTGVCGGIAKHFSLNSNIVRLVAVFLLILSGWTFLLYLVLWLSLPKELNIKTNKKDGLTDFFDNIEKTIKETFTKK